MKLFDRYDDLIEELRGLDIFWKALALGCDAGPMDGGCLIFAKALELTCPGGAIVRVDNVRMNHTVTEHYGYCYRERIYDFDGEVPSSDAWLDKFAKVELLSRSNLNIRLGINPVSEIIDDDYVSGMISILLKKCISTQNQASDIPSLAAPFKSR